MDIYCTNCGEPWDVCGLWDWEPEERKRWKFGSTLVGCPCCEGKKVDLSPAERERVEITAALADLMGDDIDGLASCLEDFGI
jgi:hypothetical protein